MRYEDGTEDMIVQEEDIEYIFNYIDVDKDGELSFEEMRRLVTEAELAIDFDQFIDMLEEANPENKETYDLQIVKDFFRSRPENVLYGE